MQDKKVHIILCGGASLPKGIRKDKNQLIHKYHCDPSKKEHNVNIDLPHLVRQVNCYFPDKIKDLLEIAAYVYAADRMTKRGKADQLEFHNWSRSFHFIIKVRDHEFWKNKAVSYKLSELLEFVSGDNSYSFTFVSGGKDVGQKSLFDNENIALDKKENSVVALFSGGLDSLAGALEILNTTKHNLLLISHQSNNFTVTSIQRRIFERLNTDYPGRLQRFPFTCSLHGERAVEETQRTRIFLYTSIAYSLMSLADEQSLYVFENGMTSINFPKRQDMMNARASRTTHPKTVHLLENFFSVVSGTSVKVVQPFFLKTKTDVIELIKQYNGTNYLNSTITCTRTFNISKKESPAVHCGLCSQCIDRKFAAVAAGVKAQDAIYDIDIERDVIKDDEGYTHLCDYVYKAVGFHQIPDVSFQYKMVNELFDIVPFMKGGTQSENAQKIYELTQKHSKQIFEAITQMRSSEDVSKPRRNRTLFSFIDNREFLAPPVERLTEKISTKLALSIPITFQRRKPAHENELNDAINALILADSPDYKREFASLTFSVARVIPDHAYTDHDLLIEAKLLKKSTSKAAITDQISADIVKYGASHKLFILYDPVRKIPNDLEFKSDFETKWNCKILIIR